MYDIVDVKHVGDYTLELSFENGEKGKVNLKDYLKYGGVFSRFSDPEYFRKVYVNRDVGTICWPDGVDIAPETLYQLATGKNLSQSFLGELPQL